MSNPLKLPHSIEQAAERLAKPDGVSPNQWFSVAVGQQGSVVADTADFFRNRAGTAKAADLKAILDRAPDVPPMPEDEIDP